jgi:glycosyltransferase involved in cell wall biosynthesis
MRIAAVSNSRIPSSTANSIQAMKVCDALVQLGHDLELMIPAEAPAVSWDELARQYALRNPFPISRMSSVRLFKRIDFVWYAHRAAQRQRADLVYTWLPQTAAVESRLGTPVVLEMHADVAGTFGAWWLRQFWKGRHGRRLLVTTVALRAALERSTRMAFPSEFVLVAPNGVDLDRYASLPEPPEARRQLHLPERTTVGFTGHLYAGRGIELLLELGRTLPGLQFLCVGGTPDDVEHWHHKVQVDGPTNLIFTGFVENSRLPLFQAAADILVMPYGRHVAASSGQDIAEVISPMKMFEYMAAGRPIVTADLPAIREVLDESRAVFCPIDDRAAWKNAIADLSHDVARRRNLAANAKREVQKHTWLARAQSALEGLTA